MHLSGLFSQTDSEVLNQNIHKISSFPKAPTSDASSDEGIKLEKFIIV